MLWWVSFATDTEFLGVVIVEAGTKGGAMVAAGDILGREIGDDVEALALDIPRDGDEASLPHNTVLGPDQLRTIGAIQIKEAEAAGWVLDI
jgi:hypothetical protein